MALNPLVAGRIECDGTREEEGCQGIIQLVLGALVSEGLDCKLRLGPPSTAKAHPVTFQTELREGK